MRDMQINSGTAAAQNAVPNEAILTGMKCLFSVDCMKNHFVDWLAKSLGEIVECRIEYVRYKPGTNCIIGYRVHFKALDETLTEIRCYAKTVSEADFVDACDKASTKLWRSPDSSPGVHFVPEYCAILYRFPNDALLKGLRALDTPRKLRRVLYSNLTEFPEDSWRISSSKLKLEIASYKPERRAVLRLSSKATNISTGEKQPLSLYLRFYADDRGESIFTSLKELHNEHIGSSRIVLPEPICYLPEERALLLRDIPGVSLADKHNPDEALSFIGKTAEALAVVHSTSDSLCPTVSHAELVDQMRQTIVASASYLSPIVPQSRMFICTLCSELTRRVGEMMTHIGLIHGDFHPGQVICQEERVGLIDFDRAQNGPQLSDIANFIANLRVLSLTNRDFPTAMAEARLIEAYEGAMADTIDKQELSYWIACRLFFLAVGPFRQFRGDWRKAILELLNQCDRELR